MAYVYAWFAAGISYSTLCLFEKNFRSRLAAVSSTHQTTTLVMLTLLGPISSMVMLWATVSGICQWIVAKRENRKIRKQIQSTTDEIIAESENMIDYLKKNVYVKCDCGHASKPTYVDTEDGGVDSNWKCPECGRTE